MAALDLHEILEKLSTDHIDYREALRRRLLNGVINAYCAKVVYSDDLGKQHLPGGPINERVWAHVFEQGGNMLQWPSLDITTFSHDEEKGQCRCDYFGVYFRYDDLAEFLPIEPYRDQTLGPEVGKLILSDQVSGQPSVGQQHDKSRRGPKRSDFWNTMTVEVARRIYNGELNPPIKSSTVRDDLLGWLVERGAAPDRTTVDSFFKELENVLNRAYYDNEK